MGCDNKCVDQSEVHGLQGRVGHGWTGPFQTNATVQPEFPIVSSSSSTLEEPVCVTEEPKEDNAK